MFSASYFDGRSARLHAVELNAGDGVLMVIGAGVARDYAYAQVRLAEPFAHAPAVLYFADGARCEVGDAGARAALAAALGYRASALVRWQQHWYAALLALLLLIGAGVAMFGWGLPAAADRIAAAIPASLDERIGATARQALETELLLPSRLSEQRVAQIERVLRDIAPARPRLPLRLLVRNAPQLGPNALALPDGTIVVTDGMIRLILGKQDDFDAHRTAQLAGVLAHEIGHVAGRHSVRVMARSSLTAAAAAALFGDFSAVAASVPALLMNMHYSREMEDAADGYAIALLQKSGISPAPLADLFDLLEEEYDASGERDMPAWLRTGFAYAASHPPSDARGARMRRAAGQ